MLKSELLDKLATAFPNVRRHEVDQVIDAILAKIQSGVHTGRRVELRGFGVFRSSIRLSHAARNPKTGADVHVPDRLSIRFRAGKGLCQRLNPLETDPP